MFCISIYKNDQNFVIQFFESGIYIIANPTMFKPKETQVYLKEHLAHALYLVALCWCFKDGEICNVTKF